MKTSVPRVGKGCGTPLSDSICLHLVGDRAVISLSLSFHLSDDKERQVTGGKHFDFSWHRPNQSSVISIRKAPLGDRPSDCFSNRRRGYRKWRRRVDLFGLRTFTLRHFFCLKKRFGIRFLLSHFTCRFDGCLAVGMFQTARFVHLVVGIEWYFGPASRARAAVLSES